MDPKQALFNYLRLVEDLRNAASNILTTQPERMSEAAKVLRTANEALWREGVGYLVPLFSVVSPEAVPAPAPAPSAEKE